MPRFLLATLPLAALAVLAQDKPAGAKAFTITPGTRVPMQMLNSVSTRQSAVGDRIYLETVFPILVDGRLVIPVGSSIAGTVTDVQRPGRVKGKGALYVRFDSMILPNGVTRDFRARVGALDGRASEQLDREEGKLKGEGNKGGDAMVIAGAASAGAMIGGVAGRSGMGTGIGAGAGAAAGLMGVLLTRGPDAMLTKGTSLEMVLDRPLVFSDEDLDFSRSMSGMRPTGGGGGGPESNRRNSSAPGILGVPRRLPIAR